MPMKGAKEDLVVIRANVKSRVILRDSHLAMSLQIWPCLPKQRKEDEKKNIKASITI